MNYQLASAIIKGKWAIDPHFAMNATGIVADILNGVIELEVPMGASSNTVYSGNSKQKTVRVFNISGSLMKNDQDCGPVGMATIAQQIKDADADNDIDAIVLHIDSPGGTVDGTQHLANTVKETNKPVVTFVDGLMASAALWVGSSADYIMAGSELDEVGSVGVLLSFADVQPFYEKQGVKFHTVTASQSTDKVKMWEELRAGNYEEYKKEFLDPIAETFISAVKENRPEVTDKHLTGKVFMAKNVMGVFIDEIGTLDAAINKAAELSDNNSAQTHINGQAANNQSIKKDMKNFENVNAALGVESLEAVDEFVSLNEEQLEAIDTAIAEGNSEELQGELNTANETIADLQAQVDNLKKCPGAEDIKNNKETDDPVNEGEELLSDADVKLFNSIKQ